MKGHILTRVVALFCLALSVSGWSSTKEGVRLYKAHKFNAAIKALTPEAEKGDTTAQLYLAFLKVGGFNHTWEDYAEGTKWLKASARGGNPYAMWQLGTSIDCGVRFTDCGDQKAWQAKAIARWKQLAKQGDGDAVAMLAEFDAGITQYIPGLNSYEYKKALKKALDMGSNRAATDYYNYFIFQASAKEKKTIVAYLGIAAKRGYMPAMSDLSGTPLRSVVGDKQQYFWTKQCALAGSPSCATQLSYFYLHGRGTSVDYINAYKWMLIGHDYSGEYLLSDDVNQLNKKLTKRQKKQAQKEADAFVKTHLPDFGDVNPMHP